MSSCLIVAALERLRADKSRHYVSLVRERDVGKMLHGIASVPVEREGPLALCFLGTRG